MMIVSEIENARYPGNVVLPETVGQFTGQTDNNGTEIFEYDIVEDQNGDLAVIVFNEYGWQCAFGDGRTVSLFDCMKKHPRVIGNIFDVPFGKRNR